MERDEDITLADGTTLTSEQVKHYRLWLSGVLEIEWRDGSRVWCAQGSWTKIEAGHTTSPTA